DDSAQDVASAFVAGGVQSILSFSPVTLDVPDAVEVRRVDLAVEMQVLSFNSSRNDASALSAAPRLGRSRGPRVTPGSLASSAQSALGTPVSSSASSSFTQNGSVITP
ncbi:MAG: redox-sensing transcriptional repressor Rex, partial [Rhodococcus fascians]